MRSLEKWQLISFFSRTTAMFLGIVQSFVIVRILTVGEFGIVQLAVAIGGALGIYQHLGLAAGSTREISAADDEDVFKIFVTSTVVRYAISIPLALGLFLLAENIAFTRYHEPALVIPLKIFAIVILVQAIQSMLNSVIAGTKRFKQLFTYQIVIAVVSLCLYIPLVYKYGVNGFFYAMLAFNVIASLTLTVIAFRPLKGSIIFPSRADFIRIFKALISISLAVYLVKVLFTLWDKSGPLLLGLTVPIEAVGIFSFALLYAKKLTHVSDSITDVNLPVFSEKFASNIAEFKILFTENFNKVFAFIILAAFSAIYWSQELITFVVGGDKYNASFPLIKPLVFAFVFYSMVNIFKSSIYVPAKFAKEMIVGYAIMLFGTVGFYYLATNPTPIKLFSLTISSPLGALMSIPYVQAMTYGMLIGAFLGFVFMVVMSQFKLKFVYIKLSHVIVLVIAVLISSVPSTGSFIERALLFAVFCVGYALIVFALGFIDKEDLLLAKNRVAGVFSKKQ